MSVPVQPGNSGGPLVDYSGNVVGVIVGKLNVLSTLKRSGDIPQNVNFAIKSSVAQTFLESNGVVSSPGGPPKAMTPPDLTGAVKPFTVFVVCKG